MTCLTIETFLPTVPGLQLLFAENHGILKSRNNKEGMSMPDYVENPSTKKSGHPGNAMHLIGDFSFRLSRLKMPYLLTMGTLDRL